MGFKRLFQNDTLQQEQKTPNKQNHPRPTNKPYKPPPQNEAQQYLSAMRGTVYTFQWKGNSPKEFE